MSRYRSTDDSVIRHYEREITEMAFPDQAQPARVRPPVVTAAVWCLFGLAAIQVISVVLTLATMGAMVDAARDYVGGTSDGDVFVTSLQIGQYAGLAFGFIFAIGFALLGVFTNRGSNVARIITWVVLGISLCCNGLGLLGAAAGGMLSAPESSSGIDQQELQRRIEDAVPGWYNPVTYSLLGLSILASLAGVILLALPAANAYFRKVEQIWEPPLPGAFYPGPGAPAEPGAPGAPAESGAPAEPGASAEQAAPADPAASAEPSGTGDPVPLDKDDRPDPTKPGTGNPPPPL
jgi:hypothetical protein